MVKFLKVVCFHSKHVKVIRPVVLSVICVGLFLILESLVPKAMALKTSNINDFRMEDQRTHKRRNYMLQRARDKKILENLENVGVSYDSDSARNPEELSAFIVDYANMIDDVILLDKSIETRTRKRGNIKLEKHNQAIPDPPCSCKSKIKPETLGENTFPKRIDTRICDKDHNNGCDLPYICQEIYYNIAILKRKTLRNAELSEEDLIPNNLNVSWVAEYKPISVGCECKREYQTYKSTN